MPNASLKAPASFIPFYTPRVGGGGEEDVMLVFSVLSGRVRPAGLCNGGGGADGPGPPCDTPCAWGRLLGRQASQRRSRRLMIVGCLARQSVFETVAFPGPRGGGVAIKAPFWDGILCLWGGTGVWLSTR